MPLAGHCTYALAVTGGMKRMKRVEKNEKELGWVYLYLSVLSGVAGFYQSHLNLSLYLNLDHLVFSFVLEPQNPGTPEPPEPRIYIFSFLLSGSETPLGTPNICHRGVFQPEMLLNSAMLGLIIL